MQYFDVIKQAKATNKEKHADIKPFCKLSDIKSDKNIFMLVN